MSDHAGLVLRARRVFPGARVVDEYDYSEFRSRCLGLLKETIPSHWSERDRLACALRGLACLVEVTDGNARAFAIRLFDELGDYPHPGGRPA